MVGKDRVCLARMNGCTLLEDYQNVKEIMANIREEVLANLVTSWSVERTVFLEKEMKWAVRRGMRSCGCEMECVRYSSGAPTLVCSIRYSVRNIPLDRSFPHTVQNTIPSPTQ